MLSTISLRARLLLIVTGISLAALVLGAFITLHNTHKAVEEEVATNLEFARRVVDALISVAPEADAPRDMSQVLRALRELRHIRTTIDYGNGRVSTPLPRDRDEGEHAPQWFIDMMQPSRTNYPRSVIRATPLKATVILEPNPIDEIDEHWADVAALLKLAAVMFGAVCVLVYLSTTRSLRPLQALQEAFERVENEEYDVRVSERVAPELAGINASFNHMVGVLRTASEERRGQSVRMVTVQEQERRAIARELHDEMAPCLFGIRSDLARIQWLVQNSQPQKIPLHITSMHEATAVLQQRVRDLLHRMRPQVLDDLGLAAALADLVQGWRRRCPEIQWDLDLESLDESGLDDTIRVTTFRAVQELLTNVAKHAQAQVVQVSVRLLAEDDQGSGRQEFMRIDVSDDGIGSAEGVREQGMGLRGLRERVQALGGQLKITDRRPRGICVSIRCPVASPLSLEHRL